MEAIRELAQTANELASRIGEPAMARRLNQIAEETLALLEKESDPPHFHDLATGLR